MTGIISRLLSVLHPRDETADFELNEIIKICAIYAQDGMSAREAMERILEVLK